MMTDLTTYTTGELERLVTLTGATCTPVECFSHYGNDVWMRIAGVQCVDKRGDTTRASGTKCRRVRSFTDLTEIDPPVGEMQRELERRKDDAAAAAKFKVGDVVQATAFRGKVTGTQQVGGRTLVNIQGVESGLTSVCMAMLPEKLTLVAPEPPKPHPIPGQVYRHRETTSESPHKGGHNLRRFVDGRWEFKESYVSAVWTPCITQCGLCEDDFTSGRYVPYTPPVISNATHAGRRVRYGRDTGRVVDAEAAELWRKGLWGSLRPTYKNATVLVFDDGRINGIAASELMLLD